MSSSRRKRVMAPIADPVSDLSSQMTQTSLTPLAQPDLLTQAGYNPLTKIIALTKDVSFISAYNKKGQKIYILMDAEYTSDPMLPEVSLAIAETPCPLSHSIKSGEYNSCREVSGIAF